MAENTPRPGSQHKHLFDPEGRRARKKGQRQETEEEKEGNRNRREAGEGAFALRDKGQPLLREETGGPEATVYKGEKEAPC